MKIVYLAIKEKFNGVNQREMARVIGLAPETICRVINGKQLTTKTCAYCITKYLNSEAEIEEYFTREVK